MQIKQCIEQKMLEEIESMQVEIILSRFIA
jgi:hypothetical protein